MFPRGALIYITDKCKLNCIHCGIVNRYGCMCMESDIFNKTIDLLYENKCFIVSLSGGDPILHPYLFEFIKNIRNHRMLPVLGLSGVGLMNNDIYKLKNSGLGCIQVSLDGKDEQTNRILRGKGVFKEVKDNVKKMINSNILVNIATCICHENINYYKEMLEVFFNMKVYEIKVQCWEPPKWKTSLLTPLDKNEKNKVIEITQDFKNAYDYHNRIYLDEAFFEKKNKKNKVKRFILFPNGDVGSGDDYGSDIVGNILLDYDKIRRYYNNEE